MSDIAKELREIADIAESGDKPHWAKLMRCAAAQLIAGDREIAELKNAVEAEREACAQVCDAESTIEGISQKCANAIRARGNK